MRNNTSKAALALSALLAYGAAQAGTLTDSNTGNLSVSATVQMECAVAQKTALSIAKLTMLDSATAAADSTHDDTANGEINAICTSGTTTPQFRFSSANGGFKLKGADGTTTIDYTLYEGNGASGTQIAYNTNTAISTFAADGTQKTLALSMKVAAADKVGKVAQAYTDTLTITTSYTP